MAILEMMKPKPISDNDFPLRHNRYVHYCRMVILADSKVLHNPEHRPIGGFHQPERDREPLAMLPKSVFSLFLARATPS